MSMTISTDLSPRSVVLDGHSIQHAGQGDKGWSKEAGTLIIRIADDGQGHKIEIQ